MTFNFNNFDQSQVTDYGLKLHAEGVEAHIKLPCNPNPNPVPEPMSMLALAPGIAMFVRKRRK
jgi:hypothetical protein